MYLRTELEPFKHSHFVESNWSQSIDIDLTLIGYIKIRIMAESIANWQVRHWPNYNWFFIPIINWLGFFEPWRWFGKNDIIHIFIFWNALYTTFILDGYNIIPRIFTRDCVQCRISCNVVILKKCKSSSTEAWESNVLKRYQHNVATNPTCNIFVLYKWGCFLIWLCSCQSNKYYAEGTKMCLGCKGLTMY